MLFNPYVIFDYIEYETPRATITPLQNYFYITNTCFINMNCNTEDYWNSYNVWAGNILVSKKDKDFLEEWLQFCLDEYCASDNFKAENPDGFRYHLYDQSILSLLFKKYNIPVQENFLYKDNKSHALFCDTREPGHREFIEEMFGKEVIKDQDILIDIFYDIYKKNVSCGIILG